MEGRQTRGNRYCRVFKFLPLPEGSYFCSLPNTQRSISGATRVKAKTGSVHMHPRARVCATVTYRCNYKIVPLLKNSRGKFGDGDEAQSSPDIFLVQLGKRHRACIGGRWRAAARSRPLRRARDGHLPPADFRAGRGRAEDRALKASCARESCARESPCLRRGRCR
jgi:hypothetical protein